MFSLLLFELLELDMSTSPILIPSLIETNTSSSTYVFVLGKGPCRLLGFLSISLSLFGIKPLSSVGLIIPEDSYETSCCNETSSIIFKII